MDKLTAELKVYNQITCKTKRNGEIIKPFAIIAFGKINRYIKKVADEFGIGCIIIHPDKDAVNYVEDLLYDNFSLIATSNHIQKMYGLNVKKIIYMD